MLEIINSLQNTFPMKSIDDFYCSMFRYALLIATKKTGSHLTASCLNSMTMDALLNNSTTDDLILHFFT